MKKGSKAPSKRTTGPAPESIAAAINAAAPGEKELRLLLSPGAAQFIEPMAARAQELTRRHFGRTISLYVPLYLSNHCVGGCVYCGFASDRDQPRRRLELDAVKAEIKILKARGFEEVLLLTGERTPLADFHYLRDCVALAAKTFHNVTVESFAMTAEEYGELAHAGCTGITIYQETYDAALYQILHRWGPKRDFQFRLEAPGRAFAGGMRTVGIGALLGLAEPVTEVLSLYRHAVELRRKYWQAGISISFPRICAQTGGYQPRHEVSDSFLAQTIFAMRICLPDVPLVLSTREAPAFRDGIAGIGINKMSCSSRTTVGGYKKGSDTRGQFEVNDTRDVRTFCAALGRKHLEPVFKNWDATFR